MEETTRQLKDVSGSVQDLEIKVSNMHLDTEANFDGMSDLLRDLKVVLEGLDAAPKQTPADIRILNRLWFDTMFDRERAISDASFGTFQWFLAEKPPTLSNEFIKGIFGPTCMRKRYKKRVKMVDNVLPGARSSVDRQIRAYEGFQRWLSHGGAFHISGKAGCGKSTLMRCLVGDPRLKAQLEQWAAGDKLIFASFYFSREGDSDQKSLAGCYRSLLFSVLEKRCDLIKDIFPTAWATPERVGAQWQDTAFTVEELRHALNMLIDNNIHVTRRLSGWRFCFFVDGLDEYDGDSEEHFELAQQLKRWGSTPHVSICVSSRPHFEFLDVFDEESRIHLHEITSLDILRLVHGEFRKAGYIEHLDGSVSRQDAWHKIASFDLLAREVVDRSNGVFLWVCLAVKSILQGKRARLSMQHILERVRRLPAKLNQLFDQMLQGVAEEDRELSAKLLLLASADVHDGVSLLMVSFLSELDDPDFPYCLPMAGLSDRDMRDRLDSGQGLLYTLTIGLFECPEKPFDTRYPLPLVSAFHLTVLEYLRSEGRRHDLYRAAGAFNVNEALARLRLADIKSRSTCRHVEHDDSLTITGPLFQFETRSGYQMPLQIFQEYENVIRHKTVERDIPGSSQVIRIPFMAQYFKSNTSRAWILTYSSSSTNRRLSVLHMAAFYGQVEVVVDKVQADRTLLSQEANRLNLLCTAFIGRNVRLVEALLALGASPMDTIMVSEPDDQDQLIKTNVWSIFLTQIFNFALRSRVLGLPKSQNERIRLEDEFKILALFIENGADLDVVFWLHRLHRSIWERGMERLSMVSLESMLMASKPLNMHRLLLQTRGLRDREGIDNSTGQDMGPEALSACIDEDYEYFLGVQVGSHTLPIDFEIDLF